MKILLAIFFAAFGCCTQSDHLSNCDYSIFYEMSMDELYHKSGMGLAVSFDFEMSNSLKEYLLNSTLLNMNLKDKIREEDFEYYNNTHCQDIKKKMIDLKILTNTKAIDRYKSVKYSNPIIINHSCVAIFMENINIDREKNRIGGATLIQFFEKKKDKWILSDTKLLEQY